MRNVVAVSDLTSIASLKTMRIDWKRQIRRRPPGGRMSLSVGAARSRFGGGDNDGRTGEDGCCGVGVGAGASGGGVTDSNLVNVTGWTPGDVIWPSGTSRSPPTGRPSGS